MAESAVDNERPIGAEARGLIRRATKAAIATLGATDDPAIAGWPSAALVTVACAMDGSPILLLSTLAQHTRNILSDSRAALLIDATDGFANPQAGPRVTVMGRIVRTEDPDLMRRFLARHPAAETYAKFGDFAVYRMEVERLHSVGGFARARWIAGDDAMLSERHCREIALNEVDALAHMNADHGDTLRLFARIFVKSRTNAVRLVGIDPDGFDLRCGRRLQRIDFPRAVATANELRAAFVALATVARNEAGEPL